MSPLFIPDPNGDSFLTGLMVSITVGAAIGAVGGGAAAAWNGASGTDLLFAAARGALLGAIGGALGFASFSAFSAIAGTYLSTISTYWAATFASGFTTGAALSVGTAWWDGDTDPVSLLWQGVAGGLGGAIFAGLGGIIFRAAAPIWLRYIGRPQGFSPQQFEEFSEAIREQAGQFSDDIVVQGSRAAGIAKPTSDVDIALRVDPEEFDELVRQSFGTPNPGSDKEETMLHALQVGKITAGRFAGRQQVRALRKFLESMLGLDVQISVIKKGGPFDQWPNIPIR
jgi:Nucleotidyltransferase domain